MHSRARHLTLRIGLVALLILGAVWVGRTVVRVWRRQRALAAFEAVGGSVYFERPSNGWTELIFLWFVLRSSGVAESAYIDDPTSLRGAPEAKQIGTEFPELRELSVYCDGSDESLTTALSIPRLRSLQIHRKAQTATSHVNLERIAGCSTLESLQITGERLAESDVQLLSGIPNLEWLNVSQSSIQAEGLTLSRFDRLAMVQLTLTGTVSRLSPPPRLQVLYLTCDAIEDFELFNQAPDLESIELRVQRIAPKALRDLQSLQRLNSLSIKCDLERAHIASLARISSLEHLVICFNTFDATHLESNDLQLLAQLKNLKYIGLPTRPLTEEVRRSPFGQDLEVEFAW